MLRGKSGPSSGPNFITHKKSKPDDFGSENIRFYYQEVIGNEFLIIRVVSIDLKIYKKYLKFLGK